MTLTLENIHHSYSEIKALSGVTLDAQAGEIVCLLGQSGCGKSTLLKLIAGILPVQKGDIYLDDKPLCSSSHHLPPEKRPVGLVFQEGALFPHLTVAQNISFGVKDKAKHPKIVSELLEQIGLEGLGERFPHTLSGGQQQRVAVARALAPQPKVILMDEPFASIDILTRRRLREETRRLLKARNCITILVTHDPEEAVEVADRIAVMESGQISQHGTAEQLYAAPQSLLVGLMAGEGSVVSGLFCGQSVETPFGTVDISALTLPNQPQAGQSVQILLRPHSVTLKPMSDGAYISDVRRTGHGQIVTLETPDHQNLLVQLPQSPQWSVGQFAALDHPARPLPAFV